MTNVPFRHGHTTVNTVRSLAVGTELPDGNYSGVLIKAPGPTDDTPNSVPIYLGHDNVTADYSVSGGFPLAPGESVTLPLRYVSDLYVVSTANNQSIAWFLV
ncbi:MAG: hypothetical protein E6Q97_38250 [Desulfurellales bacterium]|nr:MAG: hypothetical protein E6Q97_38250 [Desulfurellales bacterium]